MGVLGYSTQYWWRVTAQNEAGEIGSDSSFSFTTEPDTYGPVVASTSPESGARYVSPDSTISITLNEQIDAASVAGAVTVTDTRRGNDVAGTASLAPDGYTVVFFPAENLPLNVTYDVTVSTALKDALGNAMAADFSFSFWVEKWDSGGGCASGGSARSAAGGTLLLLIFAVTFVRCRKRAASGAAGQDASTSSCH